MCNSYSNGQCLYYGVNISELNNKCDRGDCVDQDAIKYILTIVSNLNEMQRIIDKYGQKEIKS